MRRIHISLITCAATLLLLGVGCSSGKAPQDNGAPVVVPTTTQQTVIRKPVAADPVEEALDLCDAQGYTILFKFDEAQKSNIMYCAFSETAGCEIMDFYTGRCNTSTTVAFSGGTQELENARTCGASEHPVCGGDGHTYINVCIANIQQIPIIHDGACTPDEAEELRIAPQAPPPVQEGFPSSGTGEGEGSSGADTQTTDGNTPGSPGSNIYAPTTVDALWLNSLANLLSHRKNSTIEKCVYGERVLYYQEQDCPTCFSTLYNLDGTVLCFPHNDLNNSCPNFFNKDFRDACTTVWKN